MKRRKVLLDRRQKGSPSEPHPFREIFDLVNPTREAARLSPHVRARAGDQARPFARSSVTLPTSAHLLSLPNTRGIIARCKQTAYPPNPMILRRPVPPGSAPASDSFRVAMICSSLNRLLRTTPPLALAGHPNIE